MVNQLSIFFMIISILLSIALPMGLIAVFLFKRKFAWQTVTVGALVFLVSQIFLRIPLQMQLAKLEFYQNLMSNLVVYGLFLGLTAGLFEELGRFTALKRMPSRRKFWDAIGLGLGHGGVEALIIGMQMVNNLTIALAINDGSIFEMYAAADQTLVAKMIEVLTTTNSSMFLLSGIERVCAIAIQIGFSVLVMKGVRKRDFKIIGLAILLHTLVDAPLAVLTKYGVLVTEGYVVLCAIVAVIYIIRSAKEAWQDDETMTTSNPQIVAMEDVANHENPTNNEE